MQCAPKIIKLLRYLRKTKKKHSFLSRPPLCLALFNTLILLHLILYPSPPLYLLFLILSSFSSSSITLFTPRSLILLSTLLLLSILLLLCYSLPSSYPNLYPPAILLSTLFLSYSLPSSFCPILSTVILP